MAIVGDAYVVVRAITSSVERDIQKAFNGVDRVGEKAGKDLSDGVNRGFTRSGNNFNFVTPRFLASVDSARERFSSLTRAGYVLAPSITALGGIIGLLGTGLISLTSVIGAAASPAPPTGQIKGPLIRPGWGKDPDRSGGAAACRGDHRAHRRR